MRVAVSLEQRFAQSPDGALWSRTAFPYRFWTRYLEIFDEVVVIARAEPVLVPPFDCSRVDGPRVAFAAIPYYRGPLGYLRRARQIRQAVATTIRSDDAVILRIPSPIASIIQPILMRRRQPYAVEVVGDPFDVLAPGAVQHPLRPLLRSWSTNQMRVHCRGAAAASYVTREALQSRYPLDRGAFTTSYSSIELPEEAFAVRPRRVPLTDGPLNLVTVGSLAQRYKAVDVLLDAVSLCCRRGLDLMLTVVGDGKLRPDLEREAFRLGLVERVAFVGEVASGAAVREYLDRADLFVLPSRTEGLPRAMIEAMARGLPCVGSTVGGIPDLLEPADMVPPNDATALAAKIAEVAMAPERQELMSSRNLAVSRQYHNDILCKRRGEFYHYVCQVSKQRLERRTA